MADAFFNIYRDLITFTGSEGSTFKSNEDDLHNRLSVLKQKKQQCETQPVLKILRTWMYKMKKAANQLSKLLVAMSAISLGGCLDGVETETNVNAVDPTQKVSDWKLVWSDEFDGTGIDATKWSHEVNCDGGGNNERQCYTDSADNAYVADGMLRIVALPAAEGAEKEYTSARLVTKNKADFKYGRFEVRAKLPFGQGSWPAFWMMPTDDVYGGWPRSGEIDIMEAVNLKVADSEGNVESYVHGTLHYGSSPSDSDHVHSGAAYQLPDGASPADDFHTYALEWQEGELRWYVDDVLFAMQRKSSVRYNAKGQAVGLSHRGWHTEYYDIVTGELQTQWSNAPFDQDFFMILNLAVGGDWPEAVNATGVDASAFTNGQTFEVDYVRVYECQIDPETGKGCETVSPGYDSIEGKMVEGKAPIPVPPSDGIARDLTVFDGSLNPAWPAWDCCGGSTPTIMSDADKGDVMEFYVGAEATVNGFITRSAFITDEDTSPKPFDGSPMVDNGNLSFDFKLVTAPNDSSAGWVLKLESLEADTEVSLSFSDSNEGLTPVVGEWQTYTFPLKTLADNGLDLAAIDVVMFFPDWGKGEGAVYQVTNVAFTGAGGGSSPSLTVFENSANASWLAWDCCGGSTPTVETDDDAHGAVMEFVIGATETVMGFNSRSEFTDSPSPFDATSILADGVLQFDMKVTSMPNAGSDVAWSLKIEAANDAANALELPLTASEEGAAPALDTWQTYTFKLSDLADSNLDMSALDVIMIFPAWGQGDGAVYRVDNMKVYDPNAPTDSGAAENGLTLFTSSVANQWSLWDCCGGTTPSIQNDDTAHGMTAEFTVGATDAVLGIYADDNVYYDATNLLATGVVQFELKVVTAPNDSNSVWKFKIESGDATADVELDLSASQEGVAPVVGQWQTYTYSLIDLLDAGLDISQIDIIMAYPAWGTGDGAVYRMDNVRIFDPQQ